MANVGVLYDYTGSLRASKILIAAKYSRQNVAIAENFKLGETNKSDAFLKKFPNGKVPAFELGGQYISETNAIAFHVSNDQLRGNSSILDQSHIWQWTSFADNEIQPAAANWVYPVLNVMQYNKQATDRAKEEIQRALSVLNAHLVSRTFLVGERISLADIHVAVSLLQLYTSVLDPAFRKPFGNVNRWFTTMVNQPEFIAVLGETKLCVTMSQFDPKKWAEVHGAKGGDKKAKKEPKAEKPKPAKKEAESKDDDDDEPKAKEPKDPFLALPPTKMSFDEWKKCYSNNDTTKVALPWLWEHFDAENMSVWFCTYKYADELTRIFMTCNLVGGMFQRLDRLRKHGFGSMCVFGEDGNNTIAGLWFWRGQGLAFELSEDLQIDYESYEWRKLDWNAPETKKMVTEYLTWEGEFPEMAPRKFNQGKIYK